MSTIAASIVHSGTPLLRTAGLPCFGSALYAARAASATRSASAGAAGAAMGVRELLLFSVVEEEYGDGSKSGWTENDNDRPSR